MTEVCREASQSIFCCAELFPKKDLKSKKGRQTIHSQCTTRTNTIFIRSILACNRSCIYAAMCDWFDRNNQNQEGHRRESPELSTEDLTNLTHQKDLTASGNRMRDNEDSKTIAPVSQEAGLFSRSWKRTIFVTRLAIKNEGRWTLVCREYTLPRSNRHSHFICAFKDNARTNLSRLYSIQVLTPSRQNVHTCSVGG